ncbi:glycosyltransferase [Kitasatospora sp. NPDC008115]|uniref:glycosyltransferase n=1 Tax=Kitasatospora sp. NPDC008115 TaxID=3364022 RepID=UPI0036E16718
MGYEFHCSGSRPTRRDETSPRTRTSIVFLEAAAAGLPVVAGRSGGAPDAVLDGVNGTVVDGSDPAAVATAIARILTAPAPDRARMATAGRDWVRAEWSWDTTAHRLTTFLTEEGPPAPRTRVDHADPTRR